MNRRRARLIAPESENAQCSHGRHGRDWHQCPTENCLLILDPTDQVVEEESGQVPQCVYLGQSSGSGGRTQPLRGERPKRPLAGISPAAINVSNAIAPHKLSVT